jgi:ssDNA-binding Zn-finger/Zn-ribbon topoisomerase 1
MRRQRINIKVKEGDTCPWCKSGMIIKRNGPYGQFYGCTNYFRCSFSVRIIDSSERQAINLERQADEILKKNNYGL